MQHEKLKAFILPGLQAFGFSAIANFFHIDDEGIWHFHPRSMVKNHREAKSQIEKLFQ